MTWLDVHLADLKFVFLSAGDDAHLTASKDTVELPPAPATPHPAGRNTFTYNPKGPAY